MISNPPDIEYRINEAIAKLQALREDDMAVLELVSWGKAAVEPLRKFLFEREPSGLFQPRCQAVNALVALGAKDVLIDFLAHPKDILDPVEQAGEDAVINAVARGLIRWPDDHVFLLLMKMANRKLLEGVVEALGEYRREEATSIFVAALGDDFCRSLAENAFRKMGPSACPCLLQLIDWKTPSPDFESDSSRRRRRSALMLSIELYHGDDLFKIIQPFVEDTDPQVALLACSACLPNVSPTVQENIIIRLIGLLDSSDWAFQSEVEELLIQHYGKYRSIIEKNLILAPQSVSAPLRRVVIKGCAASGLPVPQCLLGETEKMDKGVDKIKKVL